MVKMATFMFVFFLTTMKNKKIYDFQNTNYVSGKLALSIGRLISNIPLFSSSFTF